MVDLEHVKAKPELFAMLRCPRCQGRLTGSSRTVGAVGDGTLACLSPDCPYARSGFPISGGVPVLIDFERSVIDRDWIASTGAASTKPRDPSRLSRLTRRLMSVPGPTAGNAAEFLRLVKAKSAAAVVLVVGGGVVGAGAAALYQDPDVTVIGIDIYRSPLTDVVADGHQLPFADGAVDGVWIQAVLEHVLVPEIVAAEIHRVLSDDGYVYAETPFMQQVHEGAYDFTRFTPSGHRWLFRHFEEVSSGATKGPATVVVWGVRYLVAALFRSYRVGNVVAGLFFWLEYLDRFTDVRFALDGPSGVFFLGRRSGRALEPQDAIRSYRGAL